jgi:hypothetical protein
MQVGKEEARLLQADACGDPSHRLVSADFRFMRFKHATLKKSCPNINGTTTLVSDLV